MALAPGSPRSASRVERGGRVAGLDGVRALAVLAVLLYHADVSWLPGGFLGVDVFFVLSGYLITSLLLAERQGVGRVRLGRFYAGRARRLLPGLIGMVLVTTLVVPLAAPDALAQLRGDLVGAATYTSNWWSVFAHQSYFAQIGRPPLLQHLWSLGIEEQFYLLWPLAIILLTRSAGEGRRRVAKAAFVGAVASTLLMTLLAVLSGAPAAHDASRLYYGTDTHAMGLLLGAVGAAWRGLDTQRGERSHRTLVAFDLAGAAGLIGLGWAATQLSDQSNFLYHGGFLVVSAFALAVVLAAAARLGDVSLALAVPPLRWLGERSYGIYLWHWPIFVLLRPGLDVSLTGLPNLVLRVGLTLLAAELSWRYLELPVRRGVLRQLPRMLREAVRPTPSASLVRHRRRYGLTVATMIVSLLTVATLIAVRPTSVAEAHSIGEAYPGSATRPDPAVAPVSAASSTASAPAPSASVPPPSPTSPTSPAAPVVVPGGVYAYGDSVMLGSRFALADDVSGVRVDAVVGRQAYNLPSDLRSVLARGTPGAVVIHMGDNGLFASSILDATLNELAGVRRVVLVTVAVPRRWQNPVNAMLADAAHRHPNVVLADWNAAASGHPEYFISDGVHLTVAGQRAYAGVIADALRS